MQNDEPKFRFCILLLGMLFANQVPAQEPTIERPPNIILVMADDLGTEAVGCYGGTSYATPVLDAMADNGVRFNHAYSYPLCTPTRVSLMTGKYNFRNWKAFGILDPAEKTFGHHLQEQGFKTCMVGKWQLQSYDPPGYPGGELRRNTGMRVEDAGFDEYCMWHTGHTEDKGSRFADPVIYQNGSFLQNTHGKYGPDIYTDYLLDFIDRHADEPFFAYFPMALTHNPFVPTPDSEEWQDPTLRMKQDTKYFGDMVEYTDKIMGRILDKLKATGLEEETLVIFYSDNGTHQKLNSRMGDQVIWGGKGKEIDAGTRVPLIVQWKGKTARGLVSEAMIAPSDFLPTIFEAIARPMPTRIQTDGESFIGSLQGKGGNRRNWVLIDHDPRPGWDKENFVARRFIRGPQYKLYDDGRFYEPDKDLLEEKPIVTLTNEQQLVHDRYQQLLDSLRRYRTFGHIKRLDPAMDKIAMPHTAIEVIAEGFTWSEGCVWVPQEQCVLFSDVPRNIIYKWTDANGLSQFLKPAGYTGAKPRKGGKGTNGLTIDNNGKLLLCRQGDREIARLAAGYRQPVPAFESLATHWEGKRLSSPNDLCVDQAGNIYFTDPAFGLDRADPQARELDFNGVYRLAADGGLNLLTDALPTPNGIALSPDNKVLYVVNSRPPQLMAYDLATDGRVTNERVFFDFGELYENSLSRQAPDGMTVNSQGILFVAGPDGVIILSPQGRHLGTIWTGKRTSNCDLNEDETVLYVTCDDYLLRVILGYKLGFPKNN